MLAKQAWRLIHNTYFMFYRVYKSRYFTNCSFMDVEIGSNPSYVWRSLLTARDLIKEGSKWQVGDGRYIKVSTHKCLTDKPIFLGEFQPNCWWGTWFMMPLDYGIGTRCLIFLLIRHAWKFCCPFALGPLSRKASKMFKCCSRYLHVI